MKWLVAFACVCSLVSAFSNSYCEQSSAPPPVPECPPEVQPIPVPLPVVGLLTQVFRKLNIFIAAAHEAIQKLELKSKQDLLDNIRQNGGPGFNDAENNQFFRKQATNFIQSIIDITADVKINLEPIFVDAVTTIENQFALVINQPLVQSWVRELHDIIRISRNLLLKAVDHREEEWNHLVLQVEDEIRVLSQAERCQNPEVFEERFYRIVNISLSETADIINNLKNDVAVITDNFTQRVFELAHNIYDVEIVALKYFVT